MFLVYAGIIHAIGLALLLPMLVTLPGPEGESAPKTAETADVDVLVLPAPQPLVDVGPEQTSALPSGSRAGAESAAVATPEAAEPEPVQEKPEQVPQQRKPLEAEPLEAEPSEAEPIEAQTPERDGAEPGQEPNNALANVGPEAEPKVDQPPRPAEPMKAEPSEPEPPEADTRVKGEAKAEDTAPAKAARRIPKKSSAQRSRAAKPPLRRTSSRSSSRTAKSQDKFAPFNGALNGLFAPGAAANRPN
ncbi:MAG: hypothetical protein H7X74_01480 [Methyloceanibacter sp.]|nr:hypothetical protein [Methyloceanibacter sp.]